MLDDSPKRIADFLEAVAAKIRSFTVDRIARAITFITVGFVALALVALALIFLLVGVFRIAGELVHRACDCSMAMEIGYVIVGGLFLLLAMLLWSRRTRADTGDDS